MTTLQSQHYGFGIKQQIPMIWSIKRAHSLSPQVKRSLFLLMETIRSVLLRRCNHIKQPTHSNHQTTGQRSTL